MLDWCGSDEETGGKPYLDMERATESLTQQDWKTGTGLKGVWVIRVIE